MLQRQSSTAEKMLLYLATKLFSEILSMVAIIRSPCSSMGSTVQTLMDLEPDIQTVSSCIQLPCLVKARRLWLLHPHIGLTSVLEIPDAMLPFVTMELEVIIAVR